MRRPVALVLAWVLAGAVAVAAGSVAVSRVGEQVTASRPPPLSATEVRSRLDEAASAGTATAADPTAPPSSSSVPITTPSATTPTTAVTPTTPPIATTTTRTFASRGGTATLRFGPSGVTVVTAVPAAGFSVEVEPEHGTGVQVEFESDDHRSRIIGWWDGAPRSEVREDDDDGGGRGPG